MDAEDKLKYANNLIVSCLLPELVKEIGQTYLEPSTFDAFRNTVDIQLMQLFDFIQLHENFIFTSDSDTREIRCNFIILLCEQTSPCTLYQSKNGDLLKHLNELTKRFLTRLLDEDSKIESQIFNYYKEKLKSNKWNKQLGATHGFVNFLQIQYSRTEIKLPSDECTFVLSVGLLLRDCSEPTYKALSFKIFNILLKSAESDSIKSLNIHNVIFDAVLLDLVRTDSGEEIKNIWECLLSCVYLTDNLDFSKWNKVDDLIEAAIRRISCAPKIDVRYNSFIFLAKLCANFSTNKDAIAPFLEEEKLELFIEDGTKYRNLCTGITSTTSYKWAKKFLELFEAESHYVLIGNDKSYRLLRVIYVCYLVLILPIPLYVLHPHLIGFLNKFMPVLLETLLKNREKKGFKKAVEEFQKTFLFQMENYEGENKEVSMYQNALQKMIKNNVLLINK